MFVRTQRLTLRPGWPEDAAELAQAIGHESVVRNLARAPWPYSEEDAADFLALPRDAAEPGFTVFEHKDGAIRLIGCMSVGAAHGEPHDLGYWFTPDSWGRGYATEAGHAVLEAARARGVTRVTASHFIDNPQSARVLRKLGFRPTGRTAPLFSIGRGVEVQSVRLVRELGDEDVAAPDPDARLAA